MNNVIVFLEVNMSNNLNSIIKFDLHIHSYASKYKEVDGIVDNSKKENLGTLFEKLNEHKVALFSITDHNRFDTDLYLEAIRILKEHASSYPEVKNILSGVEFDVQLENDLDKCHIITIFDTHNEGDLYKIKEKIDENILSRDAAYTKDAFEKLLKNIGLDTILIAQQRKGFDNHRGVDNSLGDAVSDVEKIIKVGYINAIEYQKPKVEGILKQNLREISTIIPLFSGSDCHDWNCYPYHDRINQNTNFRHSKAKILPTFKGLLMAISSPETRFNRRENLKNPQIKSIQINEHTIPLTQGINVIIGENGSGKSTILELINNRTNKTHIKKLKESNKIQVEGNIDLIQPKYIEQGYIVEKFKHPENLFSNGEETLFKDIDTKKFLEIYGQYAKNIKKCIEKNIHKNVSTHNLVDTIVYKNVSNSSNYYIQITNIDNSQTLNNIHEEPFFNLKDLISNLEKLKQDAYYNSFIEKIDAALLILKDIYKEVKNNYIKQYISIETQNIIESCVKNYQRKIKDNSTAEDREKHEFEQAKCKFIKSIVDAVSNSILNIDWPEEPQILSGTSSVSTKGFKFNREAYYNQKSMLTDFLSAMFISKYQNIDAIKNIDNFKSFQEAVKNCTIVENIDKCWNDNLAKYFEMATKTEQYILDASNQQVGNTLGEMSLSYYDFFTQDQQTWELLIIDQPEDNISNNNIRQKLIGYFHNIREEKQIIFVTHNPLLVVNLDVDNVIYLKNTKGVIEAIGGCLESEEPENMLNIIANNMDGGKETIEKRLRFYGKEN